MVAPLRQSISAIFGLSGLGFLFLGFCTPAARAGITLESQNRYVDVNTSDDTSVPLQDQNQTASNFGTFNQSVSISLPGFDTMASQDSTLTVTPDGNGATFTASGGVVTPSVTDNSFNGTSYFDVIFDVTTPTTYELSYDGAIAIGGGRYGVDPLAMSFTGGSGAPGTIGNQTPPATVNLSGLLQPGSYEISIPGYQTGVSYDLTVQLSAQAVPVPPALWTVLASMPLLLIGLRIVSIRRQRE